jgi:hypothetical protein
MNMTSKRSGLLFSAVLAVAAFAVGCELLVTFPSVIGDGGPDAFTGDDGPALLDSADETSADAADAGGDGPSEAQDDEGGEASSDASSDSATDAEDAPEDAPPDASGDAPADAPQDSPSDAPGRG